MSGRRQAPTAALGRPNVSCKWQSAALCAALTKWNSRAHRPHWPTTSGGSSGWARSDCSSRRCRRRRRRRRRRCGGSARCLPPTSGRNCRSYESGLGLCSLSGENADDGHAQKSFPKHHSSTWRVTNSLTQPGVCLFPVACLWNKRHWPMSTEKVTAVRTPHHREAGGYKNHQMHQQALSENQPKKYIISM